MSRPTSFPVCVVPVDFERVRASGREVLTVGAEAFELSKTTLRAFELACELAAGGTIHLVHATPELTHFGLAGASGGAWFPLDSAAALDRATKKTATELLQPLADKCKDAHVELQIRPGHASEVTLKVAEEVKAGLIVLPLSGHGRVQRAVLGSTADKLIRTAMCPVLIIPA
jgi:nucleotide-binding universal stress UspA family protein